MSLFKKLLTIQQAVAGLGKDGSGDKYQYVTGNKLLGFIRPLMDQNGIILKTEVIDATFTRQDYQIVNAKGEARPKSEMFCAIAMRFTWIDAESDENLVCEWASSGMNNWDKSFGSAVTYGERYFLMKFFHIATDSDDVDAVKSPEEQMNDEQGIAFINTLTSVQDLDAAWRQYEQYWKGNRAITMAFNKRKKELINGTHTQ